MSSVARVSVPVWAVDAKEQIRLADGTWGSWLVVSDEASGAILSTAVRATAVPAHLQQTFEQSLNSLLPLSLPCNYPIFQSYPP
jgi:hypothetical protein